MQQTPELRLRGSENSSRRQPLLRPAVLRRTQSNTSLRVATNLSTPSSPAFPIDDPFASLQQPSTPQGPSPQQHPSICFPLSPVDLAALPPVGMSMPRTKWKPDQDAPVCDARSCAVTFSLLNRRHHCRACGGVFCYKCAPHMVPLVCSQSESPTLERICDGCFSSLVLNPKHASHHDSPPISSPHSSRVISATAPVTPAASPPNAVADLVPALFNRAKHLKSSSSTFPRLVPSNTNFTSTTLANFHHRSSDSDSTSPALSPRSDDRSHPTSSLDTTPTASSGGSSPSRKYPAPDTVDLIAPPNTTVSVRFPDQKQSPQNYPHMVLDPTKPCRINQIYYESEDGNNVATSVDNAVAASLTYHWSTF